MRKPLLLLPLLLLACSEAEPQPATTEAEPVDLLAAITPGDPLPDWAQGVSADIAPYIEAYGPQAMRLSPNGDLVAYRSAASGYRQVYTVPVAGGEPSVRTEGTGVTFFEWTPDGGGIVYGQDTDGDEQEAFWLLDLASGERRRLLDATEGGFRSFGAFAGDGSLFAYTSTERNGLDYDLYVHDMDSGISRLVSEGRYGQYVEAVSPDGSVAVVSTTVGEVSDNLYLVDLDTGDRTVLSEPSPRANHTDGGVVFTPDGGLLLTSNFGSEARHIYDVELPGTLDEGTSLYMGEYDAEELNLCGLDGDVVVYGINADGATLLRASRGFDPVAMPELPYGVSHIDCHPNSDIVAILTRGPQSAGTISVFEIGDTDVRELVAPEMAGLDPDRLEAPVSLRMTARDGVELQGLLYLPGEVANPPVVFDIHGGPTAQSRPGWEPETQYLLTKGIAVFHPNVRGSTGFGRTYSTLDDQRKRLDSVRDLIDMLESEELSSRVDTSRAAVRGGSYGGYMVNAVLAEYPDVFDAGVALFGVGDWVTALEVASPALKASDLIEYGDISDPEWRDFYTEISPIAQAENIRVPVLYSHGERDPRIDIHETEVMVRALRENGVEAEFVRIPDEGHGWRKLTNREFYMPIEAAFLEKHLMGDD